MADIAYLDGTAASQPGQAYKRRLLDALDLRTGLTVLDLGGGPGTDLGEMADRVRGAGGRVIGIDHDPAMVAEATARHAADPDVRVWTGDAHAIAGPDGSVDRVRMDRA